MTAGAARAGVSVATMSRRIQSLEYALGFALFERSRSGLSLTSRGMAFWDSARAAVEAIEGVDRAAAALRSDDRPAPIRVSATEPVIAEILAPGLSRLLDKLPALRVELAVSSRVVSLPARDADIAVRFVKPTEPALAASALLPLTFALFASQGYLARHPGATLDLTTARFVGYDDGYGRIPERVWLETAGLAHRLAAVMSSTRGLVAAVAAGAGVGLLPAVLGRRAGLVEIPAPIPPPRRPAWVVCHGDLAGRKDIDAVRGWIVETYDAVAAVG